MGLSRAVVLSRKLAAGFAALGLCICTSTSPASVPSIQPSQKNHSQSHDIQFNDDDFVSPMIYHLEPASDRAALPSGSAEQVLHEFMHLHAAMNYRGSALRAEDLIKLVPHRPEGYYNLACAKARLRKSHEALDALQTAIDRGWRAVLHTQLDPDLAALRNQPRYHDLIDQMIQRNHQEQVYSSALRRSSIESIVEDLEHYVPQLLNRYDVPGMSIAVIQHGDVSWSGAFGQHAHGSTRSVTPMHEAASMNNVETRNGDDAAGTGRSHNGRVDKYGDSAASGGRIAVRAGHGPQPQEATALNDTEAAATLVVSNRGDVVHADNARVSHDAVHIGDRMMLEAPVDLCTLVMALQQQRTGDLDIPALLAGADELGLRGNAEQGRRRGGIENPFLTAGQNRNPQTSPASLRSTPGKNTGPRRNADRESSDSRDNRDNRDDGKRQTDQADEAGHDVPTSRTGHTGRPGHADGETRTSTEASHGNVQLTPLNRSGDSHRDHSGKAMRHHGRSSDDHAAIQAMRNTNSAMHWPRPRRIRGTADWIRLALEDVSDVSFRSMCQDQIFSQLDMRQSQIMTPGTARFYGAIEHGHLQELDQDNDQSQVQRAEDRRFIGHTRLGTPIGTGAGAIKDSRATTANKRTTNTSSPPTSRGGNDLAGAQPQSGLPSNETLSRETFAIETTAVDLAQLIAALMPVESSPDAFLSSHIDDNVVRNDDGKTGRARAFSGDFGQELGRLQQSTIPLGLNIESEMTSSGQRIQFAELRDGCGCLVRWYPEHGTGVVIFFNSENGPEAAMRIANLAIGGH